MRIIQTTVLFLLVLMNMTFGQNTPMNLSRANNYQDTLHNLGFISEYIDLENGDTVRHIKDRYVITTKENIILVDGRMLGGMGSKCGCESMPNGPWIEKYRNGAYKSQGEYDCAQKTGTWIYYFDNGQISKIETWQYPYQDFAYSLSEGIEKLKSFYLRNGSYLEYHSNGQLKTFGNYEILEFFSETDTIKSFDLETFKEIHTIASGEFWIPKSVKSGIWRYYDENGVLLREEDYRELIQKDNTRTISHRNWELMMKVLEEIKQNESKTDN